jgi:hypothetical protein
LLYEGSDRVETKRIANITQSVGNQTLTFESNGTKAGGTDNKITILSIPKHR